MLERIKNVFYRLEQAVHDGRAAVELAKFGLGYLPWPGSALAPSALAHVVNDILINRRTDVIEFGSGLSTIYLSKALQRIGGRLESFESDPDWAELVRSWAREAGVEDVVTITVASLAPCATSLSPTLEWYDSSVVAKRLHGREVDCVLVDGPPAYQSGMALARYPALPAVLEVLAPNCAIYLDDIRRHGEREILVRWQSISDLRFELYPGKGGIARGTRGYSFNPAL